MSLTRSQADVVIRMFAIRLTFYKKDEQILHDLREFDETFSFTILDWPVRLREILRELNASDHLIGLYDSYLASKKVAV